MFFIVYKDCVYCSSSILGMSKHKDYIIIVTKSYMVSPKIETEQVDRDFERILWAMARAEAKQVSYHYHEASNRNPTMFYQTTFSGVEAKDLIVNIDELLEEE